MSGNLEDLLIETFDRYFVATGEAPTVMFANRGFKRAFAKEMKDAGNWTYDWEWPSVDGTSFQYGGTVVRCVLKTDIPTVIASQS